MYVTRKHVATVLFVLWLAGSSPLTPLAVAAPPSFQAPTTNPYGFWAPQFADIDGDGDFDAYGGDFLRVNLGTPMSADFGPRIEFDSSPGATDGAPIAADIDGDGDLDGIYPAYAYSSGSEGFDGFIVIRRNIGTLTSPQFSTQATWLDICYYCHAGAPGVVDIDGDGDLDLLQGGHWAPYRPLGVCANLGTETSPAFSCGWFNWPTLPGLTIDPIPAFADLDGDLDLDAVVAGNPIAYYENTGSAHSAAFAPPLDDPFGFVGGDPAFVDIDGDGDLDAIVRKATSSYFFENTGTITSPEFVQWSPLLAITQTDVGANAGPAFVDVDGDGDQDVFIGAANGDLRFFRNQGIQSKPRFASSGATNPFGLTNVGGLSKPAFADVDGDGDLDAVVGARSGDLLWFENSGTVSSPAFAMPETNPFGLANVGAVAAPSFADLDGDGDLDGLVGNQAGDIVFFRNSGTAQSPAFAAPESGPFGLVSAGTHLTPALVDLDDDGDLDALVGTKGGNTVFFENTGSDSSPAFGPFASNLFGLVNVGSYSAPAFADIDGDGDLDVLTGNLEGRTSLLLDGSRQPIFSDGFDSGTLTNWSDNTF